MMLKNFKQMKKMHAYLLLLLILIFGTYSCQNQNTSDQSTNQHVENPKPKNIVLMIGDGMGVSQIYAGMTVSQQPLVFEQFRDIGFQKTSSKDNYITDSGASGTALATGEKTNNGYISLAPDGAKLTTILELAELNNLATGLISTSSILHATPASFIAHNPDRNDYPGIATDFLATDIDVFIGGGRKHFDNREDGRNLIQALKDKKYQVLSDMDSIKDFTKGKLAGLTAEEHNPPYAEGRGDMLPQATQTALDILDNNSNGFFLMVEASQIDWGGHDNDQDYLISELLDFNNAVEVAMEFAKANSRTLVIVTADHECGGMSLNNGNLNNHTLEAAFASKSHTAVMVPVFAFGPGSENFRGIYDNTEIFQKMKDLYQF